MKLAADLSSDHECAEPYQCLPQEGHAFVEVASLRSTTEAVAKANLQHANAGDVTILGVAAIIPTPPVAAHYTAVSVCPMPAALLCCQQIGLL